MYVDDFDHAYSRAEQRRQHGVLTGWADFLSNATSAGESARQYVVSGGVSSSIDNGPIACTTMTSISSSRLSSPLKRCQE